MRCSFIIIFVLCFFRFILELWNVCLFLFVPVVCCLLFFLWFFLVVLERWCYSFPCTRCSCTCVRVRALFFVTRAENFFSVFRVVSYNVEVFLFVCSRCVFIPSLLFWRANFFLFFYFPSLLLWLANFFTAPYSCFVVCHTTTFFAHKRQFKPSPPIRLLPLLRVPFLPFDPLFVARLCCALSFSPFYRPNTYAHSLTHIHILVKNNFCCSSS